MLLCLVAMLAAAVPAALSAPAAKSYIVVLEDDVAHPANVAQRHEENRGADVEHVYGSAIEGYSAELTPDELATIKRDPAVDYVVPDGTVEADSQLPSTGLYRVFANTNPILDIDEVDDVRVNADVAILDSGVSLHPDLNVASRVTCVNASHSCVSGGEDVFGHGTHVAGIVGALDNNFGVVGTAPGARIWSVKVLNDGGTPEGDGDDNKLSDVVAGVNWVTAHSEQIEVANLSFGCEEDAECNAKPLREAITASISKGVVYVASAGNDDVNVLGGGSGATLEGAHAPASFPQVITVSALEDSDGAAGALGGGPMCKYSGGTYINENTFPFQEYHLEQDDYLAKFSNWGPSVDIAAPGTCIGSTAPGGGYRMMSGTSMAAPMVSGAAATLAAAKNPGNLTEVEAVNNYLRALGNYNWTDLHAVRRADQTPNEFAMVGDGVKEPLLDQGFHAPPPTPEPPKPKAPTVGAVAVTSITTNSATLHANVNPEGVDLQYWFQCGDMPGYNILTTRTYLPVGNTPVTVTAVLNGLRPGTEYHCRVEAESAGGLSVGPDQYFNTKPLPAGITLAPAEVTQSKIVLAGQYDGKGQPGTYRFQWGSSTAYGWESPEQSFTGQNTGLHLATLPVEELPVGWTLHYRIIVKTADGTAVGSDQVATTAWSNEVSSAPSGASLDRLEDISCAGSGSCFAVGSMVSQATGLTGMTGQRWNGSSWTATPVTHPPEVVKAELKGVSCTSATNCMAVGSVQVPSGRFRPVGMRWNGSAWTEAGAAIWPVGADSFFTDVSCVAANDCKAVGYTVPTGSTHSIKPLVEHWDGTSWTSKVAANPNTPGGEPSQEDNILESVSCASATVCKAVGQHFSSVGGVQAYQPLIETLSGEEWVREEADSSRLKSRGDTDAWLSGVSCPTTTMCFAVGSSAPGHSGELKRPFTQRWSGTAWSDVGAPVETNGEGQPFGRSELTDVSCTSPGACRATAANSRVLHWTSFAWKLEAPVGPADTKYPQPPRLDGISCPTAMECHAVGYYRNVTQYIGRLIQGWSGAGVTPQVSGGVGTSLTETSASLRHGINPAGVDTTYYFEYGPTEAYGSKTPVYGAGSDAGYQNTGWSEVKAVVTGLEPGTKYHYRIVASNGTNTATGPDITFVTYSSLAEMPVTEAFKGGTSAISDFATKWSAPYWVGSTHKGKNNADGFGAPDASATGAYFMPPVNDTGAGLAAQATLAAAPAAGSRISLWLDLANPASTKTGYELRLQATGTNVFTVSLKKFAGSTETNLATIASQSIPNGSKLALGEKGGKVVAWVDKGNGFVKVLEASDSSYSGGNAGVEVTGSAATRLTNFKVGKLDERSLDFDSAVKRVAVLDDFNRDETPLSLGGSWAALAWDTATVKTGQVEAAYGWGTKTSGILGAYWQKAMVSDTGSGDVTSVTSGFPLIGGYLALWLNAPNPGTAKSGYQLCVVGPGAIITEIKLVKWVNGVATTLASKTNQTYTMGMKFAIVDKGGTVSAWWTSPGGTFSQVLSATDSTYSYGYGGVEVQGGAHLRDFKLGQLPQY